MNINKIQGQELQKKGIELLNSIIAKYDFTIDEFSKIDKHNYEYCKGKIFSMLVLMDYKFNMYSKNELRKIEIEGLEYSKIYYMKVSTYYVIEKDFFTAKAGKAHLCTLEFMIKFMELLIDKLLNEAPITSE